MDSLVEAQLAEMFHGFDELIRRCEIPFVEAPQSQIDTALAQAGVERLNMDKYFQALKPLAEMDTDAEHN